MDGEPLMDEEPLLGGEPLLDGEDDLPCPLRLLSLTGASSSRLLLRRRLFSQGDRLATACASSSRKSSEESESFSDLPRPARAGARVCFGSGPNAAAGSEHGPELRPPGSPGAGRRQLVPTSPRV